MSWYDDDNQNGVELKHFKIAIEEAEKCTPEDAKIKPKVGCIIVKDGEEIVRSHRHQTGHGDHAEYIALEHSGIAKAEFNDADLITTLEPCTTRSHGSVKKPCEEWIELRNIRKVWIGTLDYNPNITGRAVIRLQNKGIRIGWFPDNLKSEILLQNREFFDQIQRTKPKWDRVKLEEWNSELKTYLKNEILSLNSLRTRVREDYPGREVTRLEEAHKWISSALSSSLLMDVESNGPWITTGKELEYANEAGEEFAGEWEQFLPGHIWIGPSPLTFAGMMYQAATKIDASFELSWISLAKVQLEMGNSVGANSTLSNAVKYLDGPSVEIAKLIHEVAKDYIRLIGEPDESNILIKAGLINMIQCLQQGIDPHEIVDTVSHLTSYNPSYYPDNSLAIIRKLSKLFREAKGVFGLSETLDILAKAIEEIDRT